MHTWLLIGIGVALIVVVVVGPELLRWLLAKLKERRAKRAQQSRRDRWGWVPPDDLER